MKNDARSLPQVAQEAIRIKAVKAYQGGSSVASVANMFQVSRVAVYKWIKRHQNGGFDALKTKPQGRPKEKGKLMGWQSSQAQRTIVKNTPDEIGLPYSLWTREAVQSMLESRYGIKQSRWTTGRLLKRWGFTPQKPAKQAREQDPKKMNTWLEKTYPKIKTEASRENAEIHWGDEMGLRSDHQTGRSYGRKGETPIVRKTGRRFSCNMISTLTNQGTLRFMVFDGSFVAKVFIDFLQRLVKLSSRKVYLIVDGHRAHKAKAVQTWLNEHEDEIKIFSSSILPRIKSC